MWQSVLIALRCKLLSLRPVCMWVPTKYLRPFCYCRLLLAYKVNDVFIDLSSPTGPEALCFRIVRSSVCACVCATRSAEKFSDWLAVDFLFSLSSSSLSIIIKFHEVHSTFCVCVIPLQNDSYIDELGWFYMIAVRYSQGPLLPRSAVAKP